MNRVRTTLALFIAGLLSATSMDVAAQAQGTPPAPPQAAPGPAGCPVATGEQMQRMQAMHQAMMKAGTPQERAKLREQQWALMHEGMGLMSSMHGGMGMGPGGGHGMGMGPGMAGAGMGMGMGGGACSGERMAMMEMMMQMMMDRMAPETPAK